MIEPTDIEKMSARRKGVPSGLVLAARVRDGVSIDELAAEYRVSPSTVRRTINDAGLSSADGTSTVGVRHEAVRIPLAAFGWLGYTEELDGAACVDHPTLHPDAWFPSTAGERRVLGAAAVEACMACPVRVTCLTRALAEEADGVRHGIRGGLDEDERAALVEGGAA